VLGGQSGQRDQQPRVDVTGDELAPDLGRAGDSGIVKQLLAGRPPGPQIGLLSDLVCRGAIRGRHEYLDQRRSRAKAGDDGGCVHAGQAAAKLSAHGCCRHHDGRAQRIAGRRAQH